MRPERINRRKNLGVEKGGTKEENREERDMPRARNQASASQTREVMKVRNTGRKVKSSNAKGR